MATKLIIVKRMRLATFDYLRGKFADDPNVRVVLDRRFEQAPTTVAVARERRRLYKSSDRDYIVVHTPGERLKFQSGYCVEEIVPDGHGAVTDERSPESWWEKAQFD